MQITLSADIIEYICLYIRKLVGTYLMIGQETKDELQRPHLTHTFRLSTTAVMTAVSPRDSDDFKFSHSEVRRF